MDLHKRNIAMCGGSSAQTGPHFGAGVQPQDCKLICAVLQSCLCLHKSWILFPENITAKLKQGRQLIYSATLAFTEWMLTVTVCSENRKIISDQIRISLKYFTHEDIGLEFKFSLSQLFFKACSHLIHDFSFCTAYCENQHSSFLPTYAKCYDAFPHSS